MLSFRWNLAYNAGMTTPPPDAPRVKWYYSVWFVLLMLVLVLGPFGLPLLWKSPRFARWAKLLFTLLTLVYTYALVVGTLAAVRSILSHTAQLEPLLH